MGGMFGGGGGNKKSSSEPKSTTADSIETADGTVYRRETTAPVTTSAVAEPMGSTPPPVAAPKMSPLETILPSGGKPSGRKNSPAGTLAGQSFGFG